VAAQPVRSIAYQTTSAPEMMWVPR
jgi:hypothetical protein